MQSFWMQSTVLNKHAVILSIHLECLSVVMHFTIKYNQSEQFWICEKRQNLTSHWHTWSSKRWVLSLKSALKLPENFQSGYLRSDDFSSVRNTCYKNNIIGHLVLYPVDRRDEATLLTIMKPHVEPGSRIFTDGWAGYRRLNQEGLWAFQRHPQD